MFCLNCCLISANVQPCFSYKMDTGEAFPPTVSATPESGWRVVRGAYISRAYIAISSSVYYFPFFSLYGRVLFGRLLASSFDAICARQLRTRFIALYTHKNELN